MAKARRTARQVSASRRNLVAARKRRHRRGMLLAGGVGIAAGVGAAAYFGTRARRGHAAPATGPTKVLVHVPGHGKVYSETKRPKRKIKRKPKAHGERVWKVTGSGDISKTRFRADKTKWRELYDYRRRRAYWQAKPVGGSPRRRKRR